MADERLLEIRLLGPFEVRIGGEPIPAGGVKQRAVLAALALRANAIMATSELIEALWDPDVSGDKRHSLQQHLSSLRRLLADNGLSDQVSLTAEGTGYRMTIARTAIDVFAFDALRQSARAALRSGQLEQAGEIFEEALGNFRGEPLGDFTELAWFESQGRALSEDRLVLTEELVDVRLALGQHRALVGELEALVTAEPFRERLWSQLMLALYRSDRQADALAAFSRARSLLVEELGIEPGEALRNLEARVLAQDPDLNIGGPVSLRLSGGGDTAVVNQDRPVYLELPDGQQVHLGLGPVLIGRAPSSGARLNDSRVSRRHAIVEHTEGRFEVRDLESTNGTFLNGTRVARHALHGGDEISLGGVVVVFRQD